MTMNLSRLSTTLGKIAGGYKEINTLQATTLSARAATLRAQITSSVGTDLLDNMTTALASENNSGNPNWVNFLQSQAVSNVSQEVINDLGNLTSLTTLAAVTEWIRQLNVGPSTFLASTCTTTQTSSSTGTPLILNSDLQTSNGARSNQLIPDVIRLTWNGSLYSVVGTASVPISSSIWPQGSGVNTYLSLLDPAITGLATDPSFALWTTTTNPTQWTSAGTGVSTTQSTTVPYTGTSLYSCSLATTSAGATVTLSQNTTVSPGLLAFHFRVQGTATHTATFVIGLYNVVGGGAVATYTTGAQTLSGAWQAFGGIVNVPTGGQYVLKVSYTPTVADSVLIDHINLISPTTLYTNGLSVIAWRGLTAPVLGDRFTLTTAIDGGLTAINGSLIRWIERLVGVKGTYGLDLPVVSSAPTYADSLVV